jgi:uncharacterized protein (TIGR03067 family)
MNKPMLLALTAGLLAGLAAAAPAPDKKEDKDAIQGTWTVVSGEEGGKPLPDQLKSLKMTFKDDKFSYKSADDMKEAKYQIDSTKKPKQLTLTPSDGEKPLEGIYELDGDKLKICINEPGGERPKDFSTKEGTRLVLFELKREKP